MIIRVFKISGSDTRCKSCKKKRGGDEYNCEECEKKIIEYRFAKYNKLF